MQPAHSRWTRLLDSLAGAAPVLTAIIMTLMRSRFLTLATALALPLAVFMACESGTEPFGPDLVDVAPAFAISDAAHDGLEGFYFLPPMVSAPTYYGTFDPALSPVVEICETPDCQELQASFSMTEGDGSEVVRRVEADEHYIVNWHSGATGAVAGKVYRIRVRVSEVMLGYADVTVVSTDREAATVRSQGSIALVAGQTLPVKFRIETGIVGAVVVSPAEAEVTIDGTQQFTATLYDLHGEELTGPAVTWASSDVDVATVSGEGLATGLSAGEAVITARADPAMGSAQLTVRELEALGIGFGDGQFALIPAGSFLMGDDDSGIEREQPAHTVTITQPFLMQKTQVTQGQWRQVMGANPSYFTACGDLCPVERVSWDDIQLFLAALNAMDPGKGYRLPTEAEWEYAARAGTTGDYGGTGVLDEMGWYWDNSGGTTHPVALKHPNDWGLYDMHGNVWEWVQDWYGPYTAEAKTDPTGPASGSTRVLWGGSWTSLAIYARSASRNYNSPNYRLSYYGFRLARTP